MFNVAVRQRNLNQLLSMKRLWKRLQGIPIPLKVCQFVKKWHNIFRKMHSAQSLLTLGDVEFKKS